MPASSTADPPPAAAKEEECKAAPAVVTKERVPESYIARIKTRPLRKMRPLADYIAAGNPEIREKLLATNALIDYLVDLEQDCLRQHADKGYAEIGVDYTGGFKKVFILPQPQGPDPAPAPDDVTMQQQQGTDGGRRSKVFVSGFAIIFALLVVLLSGFLMSDVSVQEA